MSEQYAINYADLSVIESSLRNIGSNLSEIGSELSTLDGRQSQLEDELAQLSRSFSDFVEADQKFKNLQLAETRVGNLRQELQIKFGYYGEIRRMATGILQSVDSGIVGDETIKSTTEEVMIKAPGYWLAPTLVALASWIRDDKATCNKALEESLRRDDYKSTLFFMLVTRRLGRHDATLNWLDRYFLHQDPLNLDREFITVLEAVTTGVFHPASRTITMKFVKNWLNQLTQGDRFINEQKSQWAKYFQASKPALQDNHFPFLKQYAKNWDALENSLRDTKTHDVLHNFFKSIIASSSDFSSSVKTKLDEILAGLVTNFDDEELPLQRQVRLNQLVIEKDGDKKAAQSVMDAEQNVFKEKIDLLQMLTNAAFNPEAAGVTRVTQALAVSISQQWITEAHDTFTAQSRNRFPLTVDLVLDGFETRTKDGSDEKDQISKQEKYYSSLLQKELSAVPFPTTGVVIGGLIGVGGFIFGLIAGLVSLAIGVAIIWSSLNNVKKKKEQMKATIQDRMKKAGGVLRGCLAEAVDFRKELATEDSKAENVRQLLESIAPQDFSSVSRETARNII